MSRGPLTALLGVLAVAGFQNRDKIAEVLKGLTQAQGASGNTPGQGGMLGGILDKLPGGLGGLIQGQSAGGLLSGGLGGLLDQFQQTGHQDKAQSWVKNGPNEDISADELSHALGPDVLADLSTRTGLSREELLARLSQELPKAVDGLTPEGHMPVDENNSPTPSPFGKS